MCPKPIRMSRAVWNPIYIGTLCFACNTDWFARTGTPMPTCWDDLLSPALAGQIVMATPKSSGTSYTTLATLVQMRGEDKAWEYLQKLDQNVGLYTRSGVEPAERVKNGEYAVGIVFSHDAFRAALDGYPIECAVRQTAPAMRSARARLCVVHRRRSAKTPAPLSTG